MNGRVPARALARLLDEPCPLGVSLLLADEPGPLTPLARVSQEPDDRPTDEESEWILAAQNGDRSASAKLVERYWDRLYRWLYQLTRDRHQAEDLVQESFMKALAAIGSFRTGSNFRAWLFRIGHNNFVNLKRSEKRTKHPLPDDAADPASTGTFDRVADREAVVLVQAAVDNLPADFRAALLLHTQEGLSYREIAAIVKTTEETARWRVFKARQKLMKVLSPDLIPPAAKPE